MLESDARSASPLFGDSEDDGEQPRDSENVSSVETRKTLASKRHGIRQHIVQELCESRGGRPGLSVHTNLLVSVDVKQH